MSNSEHQETAEWYNRRRLANVRTTNAMWRSWSIEWEQREGSQPLSEGVGRGMKLSTRKAWEILHEEFLQDMGDSRLVRDSRRWGQEEHQGSVEATEDDGASGVLLAPASGTDASLGAVIPPVRSEKMQEMGSGVGGKSGQPAPAHGRSSEPLLSPPMASLRPGSLGAMWRVGSVSSGPFSVSRVAEPKEVQGQGFRSRLWTGSTASLGDVDGQGWGYDGHQLRRSASPAIGDVGGWKWREEEEKLVRARQAFTQARYQRRPDRADDTASAFLGDEKSVNDHNFFRGFSAQKQKRRWTIVGRGDLDIGGLMSAVGGEGLAEERGALLSGRRRHLADASARARDVAEVAAPGAVGDAGYFIGSLSGDEVGSGGSDAEADRREGADPVERALFPSTDVFSSGDGPVTNLSYLADRESRHYPGVLESLGVGHAQESREGEHQQGVTLARDVAVQDRSGGPTLGRSTLAASSRMSSSTPMLVHLDEEPRSDEAVMLKPLDWENWTPDRQHWTYPAVVRKYPRCLFERDETMQQRLARNSYAPPPLMERQPRVAAFPEARSEAPGDRWTDVPGSPGEATGSSPRGLDECAGPSPFEPYVLGEAELASAGAEPRAWRKRWLLLRQTYLFEFVDPPTLGSSSSPVSSPGMVPRGYPQEEGRDGVFPTPIGFLCLSQAVVQDGESVLGSRDPRTILLRCVSRPALKVEGTISMPRGALRTRVGVEIRAPNAEAASYWKELFRSRASLQVRSLFNPGPTMGQDAPIYYYGLSDVGPFREGTPGFPRLGKGRFSNVVSATRKNGDGAPRALKIMNKQEFWDRVRDGQERRDSIARGIFCQLLLTIEGTSNDDAKGSDRGEAGFHPGGGRHDPEGFGAAGAGERGRGMAELRSLPTVESIRGQNRIDMNAKVPAIGDDDTDDEEAEDSYHERFDVHAGESRWDEEAAWSSGGFVSGWDRFMKGWSGDEKTRGGGRGRRLGYHILRLHSIMETVDELVLEMDLMSRESLGQYIDDHGSLTEPEAAGMLRNLLLAIEECNQWGVCHRDVKIVNLLYPATTPSLVPEGVVLGDFDLATKASQEGLVRGRCGTAGYVAPEILNAGEADPYTINVDMYSAGVVLYTCLYGFEPFYATKERALREANRVGEFSLPFRAPRGLSVEVKDLIKKMMEKDPSKRLTPGEALRHPWIRHYFSDP